MVAYYCFENLGWPPSKYCELPERERMLVKEFVLKSLKEREKIQREVK